MSETGNAARAIAAAIGIELTLEQASLINAAFGEPASAVTAPDINAEAIAKMKADWLQHDGPDIGCGC